jgi:hypothetical protein
MTTAKQTRRKVTSAAPAARGRKTQSSQKTTVRELYARLEKTKPGSANSKRISEQIVDAIG